VHLLMDVLVGVLGLLAILACVLAWRLAQGPIDITRLAQREEGLLGGPGTHVAIGAAALAWEGFVASDQPLHIRVQDVHIGSDDGSLNVQVPGAQVTLAIGQLLLGRIVPRSVSVDHAEVTLERGKSGALDLDFLGRHAKPASNGAGKGATAMLDELSRPARQSDSLPWLSQLRHVQLRDAALSLRDADLGLLWQAPHVALELRRLPGGGVTGHAEASLELGAVHARLSAQAELRADGTHLTASLTPVSPAALARLAPQFAVLSALDAPVQASLDAAIGPALQFRSARLDILVGAGTVKAGKGGFALQSAAAVLTAQPGTLRLESLRLAYAALDRKAPPPLVTGSASATIKAGLLHASFAVAVDKVELGDLADYWPAGTGGGSRPWLVENITAGHARDAHAEGSIETPVDFSDVRLTALSGGVIAENVTLFWLRPVPPVTRGRARVKLEGPDSLLITLDSGEQDQLRLMPGSFIRITNLEEKHQFGDLDVRMEGPLDNALHVLNHPRLNLLARSKLDFTDASGQVSARLTMHIPLEDKVTMDDIGIAATAHLRDVHLGRIAVGRDLDGAALSLKVDNNGLNMSGSGQFGGIPTDLSLDMDFRDGKPDQVQQHVVAHGTADVAQAAQAGLPPAALRGFTGGSAALSVDYSARRDASSTVLLDVDLAKAALKTPVGWKKDAGSPAHAGARLLLDHGKLVGVDRLRAEGPGLLIASHVRMESGRTSGLVIDRMELGRTRATGDVRFAAGSNGQISLRLSGPVLDLSTYLDEPAAERATSVPAATDNAADQPVARSDPWQAELNFGQVQLAKGKILAPFRLSAASDGLHIHHADVVAGAPGALEAHVVPVGTTRHVSVTSMDAGFVLQALGVADNLNGGQLQLQGVFADAQPGDPLAGTATLQNFDMRAAPAIGRLLQAMTLYGLVDVLRGPGLHFAKMVAPFRWARRILHLENARAFSPSLGLTAQGDIDLKRRIAAIRGTVVPAYFFNQLLGDLPIVGRIFSPEKGGGVFAARYSVTGPLSDPKVGVNPLSALTPGFLREGFGLFLGSPAKN
jgi:hypothetical protein